MNERSRELAPPLALRLLPLAGFAAIAVLALAWSDHIPGAYVLRGLVGLRDWSTQREVLEHAAERLERFEHENALVVRGTTVFVGSSTIERYPLDTSFPGKSCANRGIRSATIPLLQRFTDAIVPSVPLGGIVLYAGSIDLREPGLSGDAAHADAVAAAVRPLIEAVRRRQPDAPLTLVGVLPARTMDAKDVAALARLNAHLRELAHEIGVAFVDTARAPIATPAGALAVDHSADELHLDARGYDVLSKWIVADGGEVGRRLAP